MFYCVGELGFLFLKSFAEECFVEECFRIIFCCVIFRKFWIDCFWSNSEVLTNRRFTGGVVFADFRWGVGSARLGSARCG